MDEVIVTISGPPRSGKKRLARWLYQQLGRYQRTEIEGTATQDAAPLGTDRRASRGPILRDETSLRIVVRTTAKRGRRP